MEKPGQWRQTWNMLIRPTPRKDQELTLILPIFPKPVGRLHLWIFYNDGINMIVIVVILIVFSCCFKTNFIHFYQFCILGSRYFTASYQQIRVEKTCLWMASMQLNSFMTDIPKVTNSCRKLLYHLNTQKKGGITYLWTQSLSIILQLVGLSSSGQY